MITRTKCSRIRRALAQPDLALAVISLLFLGIRNFGSYPPRVPWWLIIMTFATQATIVHGKEYLRLSRPSLPYRGRGPLSWGSGLILWSWAISQTGGLSSPVLLLSILLVLHNLRNPRRQRYTAVLLLLVLVVVFSSLAGDVVLAGWTVYENTLPSFLIILFSIIAGAIALTYCLFFAECCPVEVDFLVSGGTFGHGYVDQEDFFRAVLARAVRIYQADGGFVALRQPQSGSVGDPKCHGMDDISDLRIYYRAGLGADDPLPGKEPPVVAGDTSYIAVEKGRKTRRSWRALRMEHNMPVRVEFSFALRRFQTQDLIGVVTVFARNPFRFVLPSSSYYLEILCGEAETLFETIIFAEGYRRLLAATDRNAFLRELNAVCNQLLLQKSRTAKIGASITASKTIPEEAIVFEFGKLAEGRRRLRRLAVSAEMQARDVPAVQTLRYFLEDVASANVIKQMADTTEALEAAEKGLIGLSNLELPEDMDNFKSHIALWRKGTPYDEAFVGFGFPLLWANRLMRSWFPSIPENLHPHRSLQSEKSENGPIFCYHYYNSEKQQKPCWGCPCLELLVKYVEAPDEKERDRVMRSTEVRPSHSPAGKMQIFRHYALGASLVHNAFPPQGDGVEDEISFIRETVVDRTLEVESLAIIVRISKAVEMFAADKDYVLSPDPEHRKEITEQMERVVIESLGRSSQANHVLKVNIGGGDASGKLEAEYVCAATEIDDNGRKRLADKEREVMETVRKQDLYILRYFEERKSLFSKRKFSSEDPIPAEIADKIRQYMESAGKSSEAVEISSEKCPALFGWRHLANDRRCIIVRVGSTSLGLIIATGEPEDWEKVVPGGSLSPRVSEMELCQCIGDMLGYLLQAMNVASEYGAMMITTKVRQLLHEMSVLFASMPADANSMREQIRKNVVELEQILEITRKYELGDLVKQWHQLAEKEARFKGLLPYDKKLKIKRDYIRLIFPEGIGPLDPDILDTIAQSGIEPEKLGDLHKLRVIPVKDKSNLLEFFADLISALRTIRRIEDTDEFVRNVFRGVLGEVMIKEVHLASFLERLVGLISAGSPACKIRIDIPANLVAVVDRPTLGIVAKNFICNAIEAIGSFQTERDEIYVTAKIEKDDLIIDVVSPPPLIPPEVVSKMFYPEFTTKPGWGRGLGLATARDIAQQAGATIEYHAKNGKNVFTLIFPQSKMGPVVGRNKK